MSRSPKGRTRKAGSGGAGPHAVSPSGRIFVDIDPSVSGGFILGRFDILIRGRAIAAEPIEEIGLLADGGMISCVMYGEPERAATVRLPDGTEARQRSFQFSLARLEAHAAGPCSCRIVVRTASERVHEEPFELSVDPDGPDPVVVRSGPVYPAANYASVRPPAIIFVERALLDNDRNLQVYGWTIAQSPIILVQAFVGEQRVGSVGVTGERDDVARVYPAYPNARISGFVLNARLGDDIDPVAAVRAQVICQHGFSHEVAVPVERVYDRRLRPAGLPAPQSGVDDTAVEQQRSAYQLKTDFSPVPEQTARVTAPVTVLANDPRREIHMFCDKTSLLSDGRLLAVGWAVCAVGIARITVFFDGQPVGQADYGMERQDVGAKFPAIPTAALSGFRFETTIEPPPEGEHTVHVVVTNGLDDDNTVSATVTPEAVVPEEPHPSTLDRPEFRFEMDTPSLVEGAVIEPITGRLTIEGWVLARSGVTGVRVFLDDMPLGEAHYGLARQDVGVAFPDWVDSLRSGYAFHCPPRSLRDGDHTVRLVVASRNGQEHAQSFLIHVKRSDDKDDVTNVRRRATRAESRAFLDVLDGLEYHPRFLWLVRLNGPLDLPRLQATMASLQSQMLDTWRARLLCDRPDQAEQVREAFANQPEVADRFQVITPDDRAWDAPLASTDAEAPLLCGLLSVGDELGCDAMAEFALAGGLHPAADFLYADEARISPASREREAFFKPDFSPELLLSTNYIGRPWVVSAAVMARTGATPRRLLQDGEYDLVLRCSEHATAVRHVAKLLCQRGVDALDDAVKEQAALERAAVRQGLTATVLPAAVPGTWRMRHALADSGKVSIIIPTCAAHGYIETCITTLRAKTAYPKFEIIVVDNIPASQESWKDWVQQHADKVVDIPDAFNWSRFNNRAVEVADGDYLLFLNDDIEIDHPEWLDAMLEHAQQPGVGAVGPQLLYPDRVVQHAGMFLSVNGLGRHAFRFSPEAEPGYFGLALTQRNVIAVTGACMLVRREVFERLGRFDEAHEVINNDLDFCLRAHRAGLRTVFTPYATLIHHELASRAKMKDDYDLTHFNAQWKTLYADGDPYFNPRLSRHSDDYRPDDEPLQSICAGHPLFDAADIKRILVVKLDHIGDFVAALPAIRRLKQLFPHASITVLGGRASRAFVSLEPSIDLFLEFDFFHARSQLGERVLTAEDFEDLRGRLAPYRFDLAVDLRKHLSTRDVLRYAGARFCAGFDYMGQFPFLDIALEWDGDKALQRKRGHIVDDLLALVGAIGDACTTETQLISPTPPVPSLHDLPTEVQPLFDRPVVVVHAGAGNITKQWPLEHFSSLIDLLIERDGVNVILIGGPDEVELVDRLLGTVLYRDAIVSVAGKTSLSGLATLMRACALYIGNDSGPKHIAAALGVPTVGIHSGVVDATEWAPMGRRAVALRRNMSCAPCYLQHATDCPRNLACLRFLEPALVHQTAQMLLARPVSQQVPIRRQSADEPEPVEAAITVVSTPTVAVRPRTVKAKTARRSQVKRARA
jgi:ADP-heptose:LPS heptosyltransferase/GT2 family glycosyltransferase